MAFVMVKDFPFGAGGTRRWRLQGIGWSGSRLLQHPKALALERRLAASAGVMPF
jgi:hypothetical protein